MPSSLLEKEKINKHRRDETLSEKCCLRSTLSELAAEPTERDFSSQTALSRMKTAMRGKEEKREEKGDGHCKCARFKRDRCCVYLRSSRSIFALC